MSLFLAGLEKTPRKSIVEKPWQKFSGRILQQNEFFIFIKTQYGMSHDIVLTVCFVVCRNDFPRGKTENSARDDIDEFISSAFHIDRDLHTHKYTYTYTNSHINPETHTHIEGFIASNDQVNWNVFWQWLCFPTQTVKHFSIVWDSVGGIVGTVACHWALYRHKQLFSLFHLWSNNEFRQLSCSVVKPPLECPCSAFARCD